MSDSVLVTRANSKTLTDKLSQETLCGKTWLFIIGLPGFFLRGYEGNWLSAVPNLEKKQTSVATVQIVDYPSARS